MKIRLMGPEDVVRSWAARFESFGIGGDFYPMRGRDGLRWYADVDDRLAASATFTSAAVPPAPAPPPASGGRRTRRK